MLLAHGQCWQQGHHDDQAGHRSICHSAPCGRAALLLSLAASQVVHRLRTRDPRFVSELDDSWFIVQGEEPGADLLGFLWVAVWCDSDLFYFIFLIIAKTF
jgi:hypothetical protein